MPAVGGYTNMVQTPIPVSDICSSSYLPRTNANINTSIKQIQLPVSMLDKCGSKFKFERMQCVLNLIVQVICRLCQIDDSHAVRNA